jgi:hypothetical protein
MSLLNKRETEAKFEVNKVAKQHQLDMSYSTPSKTSPSENPFQFCQIIAPDTSICYYRNQNSAHVKLHIPMQEKQAKSKSGSSSWLCQFSVMYCSSVSSVVFMTWFIALRVHHFSGYAANEAIASISSWSRSASMNTSRFSPSMTSAMEWWVIPTRWSVTRPWGKLYVLIRSDLSPLPIC